MGTNVNADVKMQVKEQASERHSLGATLAQLKLMLAKAVKRIIQRRLVICGKDTDSSKAVPLTHILLSI